MPSTITVDPNDDVTFTFRAVDWCANEGGGVTLSTLTVTPSATVTIIAEGSVTANAKTIEFSATASGSIAARYVFSDGNERERTLYIRVQEM